MELLTKSWDGGVLIQYIGLDPYSLTGTIENTELNKKNIPTH